MQPRERWGARVLLGLGLAMGLVVPGLAALVLLAARFRRWPGTPTQRAAYQTLHTAGLAAPALRTGLTEDSARSAVPLLRGLLGTDGAVLAGRSGVIAADGIDDEHLHVLEPALAETLASGRSQVLCAEQLACIAGPAAGGGAGAGAGCPLQAGVVVPIVVEGAVVAVLATLCWTASAGLLRLAGEVARFVASQLELAELDRSRRRAELAELRYLRAQISPHFLYNALNAVESFVRTDPDRARDLLVGFADYIRYSFASHGQLVSLAEELRLVDTYLDLERARFGGRLTVNLRVAPGALSVTVPALVLQPIVENAVRHGLEPAGCGQLSITIAERHGEASVCVEDDGVGAEPAVLRNMLAGAGDHDGVGLHNVDERLRALFGDGHGLQIDTYPGRGTKVTMRIPACHADLAVP